MISVICCYNDKKQYQNMVFSLDKQTLSYELIGIDNFNNDYSSAASALNAGGAVSRGDILVFLHQDILFDKPDSLEMFVSVLKDSAHDTIIGLYGAAKHRTEYQNNLEMVDTLDECCIAMRKETWDKYQFNEILCDNWHLYVVEMCIRVKQAGGTILTGNFDITHLSDGNVNEGYMLTFKRLIKEYKSIGWISTTCKSMPTSLVYYYLYYIPWVLKKKILGNYPLVSKIKHGKK